VYRQNTLPLLVAGLLLESGSPSIFRTSSAVMFVFTCVNAASEYPAAYFVFGYAAQNNTARTTMATLDAMNIQVRPTFRKVAKISEPVDPLLIQSNRSNRREEVADLFRTEASTRSAPAHVGCYD
jgi:hypothetical protein